MLEFGGVRIGLIHGNRDSRTEFTEKLQAIFRPWTYTTAFFDYILSRFTNVDAIVFGHTHIPYAKIHNGVFLFNPGSLVPRTGEPSVGMLEIDTRGIRGRIINLRA